MRARETNIICFSCFRTHTQSLGQQARKNIRGRSREWNDAYMEDKASSTAVAFKVLQQKHHHLGTCQKCIFSGPNPDLLDSTTVVSTYWFLPQWFSNFHRHQNHLEGSLKPRPILRISDSEWSTVGPHNLQFNKFSCHTDAAIPNHHSTAKEATDF